MVIRYKYMAIATIVIILGAVAAWWFFPRENDETQIRTLLNDITANISKKPTDGTSGNILKSNALPRYFVDPCEVSVGVSMISGTFSEHHIVNNSMRIRTMFKTISAQIDNISIYFDAEREFADVEFGAIFNGIANSGERVHGVRDLRCRVVKDDGKWKIQTVNIRQVLEK